MMIMIRIGGKLQVEFIIIIYYTNSNTQMHLGFYFKPGFFINYNYNYIKIKKNE